MNRHAIRKCGKEYAVVFHHAFGIDFLYKGSKDSCKVWLKEQIKLLRITK
jgi:hypothetical protein